jgi:hypothetical protein
MQTNVLPCQHDSLLPYASRLSIMQRTCDRIGQVDLTTSTCRFGAEEGERGTVGRSELTIFPVPAVGCRGSGGARCRVVAQRRPHARVVVVARSRGRAAAACVARSRARAATTTVHESRFCLFARSGENPYTLPLGRDHDRDRGVAGCITGTREVHAAGCTSGGRRVGVRRPGRRARTIEAVTISPCGARSQGPQDRSRAARPVRSSQCPQELTAPRVLAIRYFHSTHGSHASPSLLFSSLLSDASEMRERNRAPRGVYKCQVGALILSSSTPRSPFTHSHSTSLPPSPAPRVLPRDAACGAVPAGVAGRERVRVQVDGGGGDPGPGRDDGHHHGRHVRDRRRDGARAGEARRARGDPGAERQGGGGRARAHRGRVPRRRRPRAPARPQLARVRARLRRQVPSARPPAPPPHVRTFVDRGAATAALVQVHSTCMYAYVCDACARARAETTPASSRTGSWRSRRTAWR